MGGGGGGGGCGMGWNQRLILLLLLLPGNHAATKKEEPLTGWESRVEDEKVERANIHCTDGFLFNATTRMLGAFRVECDAAPPAASSSTTPT